MDDALKSYIKAKTEEMIKVPYCCDEAKKAAESWLAALGTPEEAAATESYLAELAEDIEPIDGVIAFAGSQAAAEHFGKEMAAGLLSHAKELKASGAKYCDCEACSPAAAILEKTGRLA